jgi:hypothetical protein
MKGTIITALLFAACTMFGQASTRLSKTQMYQDFDTLVATMYKVSPHLPVKQDLWHYDAKKHLSILRRNIDTISTDLSFYILLESALNLAQDLHTSLLRQESDWALKQYNELKKIRNSFKFSIGNIYNQGKYFISDPFLINGDTIAIGTQITHVNNEPIDNYLKKRLHTTDGIAYDLDKNKFYYCGLFKNTETLFQDSIKITLRQSGSSKSYTVSTRKFTKYLPSTRYSDTTRVEYWEAEKIIYIRLTDMEPEFTPFINAKLAKIKTDQLSIDKIIIDIRGNGGGQDNVWQNLYAELIANPITYDLKIDDYNNAVLSKEKVESFGFENVKIEKEKSRLLKRYSFYTILNTKETIAPSPTSLMFKGKIFLLAEGHYSSAGSAVSVASSDPTDNLISVGRKTGYFLGVGFSPQAFVLPHSKLKYRIAPSIEVSNTHKLADLMQDKIEISIPYDLQYYQNKFEYKGEASEREFLIKFDPFIKAVLKN